MRTKILSAGLLVAFLPGTCAQVDGLLTSLQGQGAYDMVTPFDVSYTLGSRQILFVDEPEDDEPVEPPDDPGGTT